MATVATGQDEFMGLLSALSSSSDVERNAAESSYNQLDTSMPEQLLSFILTTISAVQAPMHLRELAVVLLRRALIRENSIYNSITPSNQPGFRAALLLALEVETNMKLKLRISEVVGNLFYENLEADEWPELMHYIVESLQGEDPIRKEVGLGLLGMLPQEAMNMMLEGGNGNLASILNIFQSSLLDDSNDGRMMLQALRSLSLIFASRTRVSEFDLFESLLPALFQGLELSIKGVSSGRIQSGVDYPTFGDVSHDVAYAQMMVELADASASYFCLKLNEIFDPFMTFLQNKDIKSEVRYLLLEFLVSLCEGAPKLVRKLKGPTGLKGHLFESILPVCVRMMLTIEEKNFEQWGAHVGDDNEEEDEDQVSDAEVGESVLDRISKCLGSTHTYTPMLQEITSLLADKSTWASSYVALRVIGNYVEVVTKLNDKEQLKSHVQEVVGVIVAYTAHPDQRVQDACFFALSCLLINHGKILSEQQLDAIMSVVLASVSNCSQVMPRLRKQYVVTLTNFIDYVESDILEKYTGVVLERTILALSVGPQKIQECCINAIIALSESISGLTISAYYDAVIPILKQLLDYSSSNKLDVLYGQTMECFAMFGESSGKEKFQDDAREMMHSMVHLESQFGENSLARPFLMRAWVRVARCLGTEFTPFLPLIMGNLLKAASMELEIITRDIDEDIETQEDVEILEDDEGWAVVRSSAVEEKSAALNLVFLLAEKLQGSFYPYVESSIQVMVPLMKSPHEDIRSLTIASLPEFVKSSAKALIPHESVITLSNHLMGELVQLLQREESPDIINTALGTLNTILVYTCADWTNEERPCDPELFTRYLSQEQIVTLLQSTLAKLREAIQRRAVLKAQGVIDGDAEEEDEEDEMLLMGSNEELFFNIDSFLNGIMQTHGELFLGPYESVLQELIIGMAHVHCLAEDRSFALTVICDMIRLTVESEECAQKLYPKLLPIIINDVHTNQDAEKRRECAAAIGKAFSSYPQALNLFSTTALQSLGQCVAIGDGTESRARCEATDSAVAAIGNILMAIESQGQTVSNVEYVWRQWLDYLPLRFRQYDECTTTINLLIELLKNDHPVIADLRLTEQVWIAYPSFF